MRQPILVANWKMNTTRDDAVALARAARETAAATDTEIVLCPPYIWLEAVAGSLDGGPVRLGAQDGHPEPRGAYTGEVSMRQVAALCTHVIVGHSERRRLFGDTDEVVAAKLRAAREAGLTPILVVGEDESSHAAGRAAEVVVRQLESALDGAPSGGLVLAYEPVWAIGSGRPAGPAEAQAMAALLRGALRPLGADADGVRVLYGGSVRAETFGGFMEQADIDGALVGGASLEPAQFAAMAHRAAARA